MLNQRDLGNLLQIISFSNRIIEYTSSISKQDYDNSLDCKEILCFNLLQIGELAGCLTEEFIKEYNKIPWKQIKGMRNRIAHVYGSINYEIVYSVSINDVPSLKNDCEDIIKRSK